MIGKAKHLKNPQKFSFLSEHVASRKRNEQQIKIARKRRRVDWRTIFMGIHTN